MPRYMSVGDLRLLLEDYEDDAQVFIMTQESYPFENSCAGICAREDFTDPDECDTERNSNDVFLCEGTQLRYGSKDAWQHARISAGS
jgi:hypothetical protein